MLNGAQQSLLLFGCEANRAIDADAEVAEPNRTSDPFRRNREREVPFCEIASAKVFGSIEGCAGAERCQKKLRWSHAGVRTAIFLRLIAGDRMSSRPH